MLSVLLLASLVQQGQAQPQQPALPPSPVARIEVTPANPTVFAQDTLRLRARALDANGNVVSAARIRFTGAGARFEGSVSDSGLITSGATGRLPVSVIATVPGTDKQLMAVDSGHLSPAGSRYVAETILAPHLVRP